tara:strand:+ start:191182 stop:193737 length:2556 start_codon:yes stop_codon:yes gene_type:complete
MSNFKVNKCKIVSSLVAMSVVSCLASTAHADGALDISQTMLDSYTNKFEEADIVLLKLSDVRVASMSYWAANAAWPGSLADLVSNDFYFGSFDTTFGTSITGFNDVTNYQLGLVVGDEEIAKYISRRMNGTYTDNGNDTYSITIAYGTPVVAAAQGVSLARYADASEPDANTMFTDLDMGGFALNNAGSIQTNAIAATSSDGNSTLNFGDAGLQYNGSEVITAATIGSYTAGDADSLDGLDSSSFVQVDENGYVVGTLNLVRPNPAGFFDTVASFSDPENGTETLITMSDFNFDIDSKGVSAGLKSDEGINIVAYGDEFASGISMMSLNNEMSLSAYNSLTLSSDSNIDLSIDGNVVFTAYQGGAGVEITDSLIVKESLGSRIFTATNDELTYKGSAVITADNIGSYVSTDADTLDGYDSSAFIMRDIEGYVNGTITLTSAEYSNPLSFQDAASSNISSFTVDASGVTFGASSVTATNYNVNVANSSGGEINISDTGGGGLNLHSDYQVQITSGTSDAVALIADASGNVQLYGAGAAKLSTSADGVDVEGRLRVMNGASEVLLANSSAFQYNGSDVITAANIGSYVSSDADTLDGYDSSDFVKLHWRYGHVNDELFFARVGNTAITFKNYYDNGTRISSSYGSSTATTEWSAFVSSSSYKVDQVIKNSTANGKIQLKAEGADGSILLAGKKEMLFYTEKVGSGYDKLAMKIAGSQTSSFVELYNNNYIKFATTLTGNSSYGEHKLFSLVNSANSLEDSFEYANFSTSINGVSGLDAFYITPFGETASAISYDAGSNVWATNADLSAADIDAVDITASTITAVDIEATGTLTVGGVDVGAWIANCEANGCNL